MFKKDPNLRGPGELVEMEADTMQEYLRCSQDIFHFCKYFHIVAADGEHSIVLREYQERLMKCLVTKYRRQDGSIRNNRIFMMGRQSGKTTIATVYLLWYALFHESKTIAILANKESQALEIMMRIQLAYYALPMWLQQGLRKFNNSEILMENGTRIFAAASSSSAIRGKTVDLMLVDEFAHLDNNIADSFMKSVFPTQASRPDSMLLLISTPKGLNHFYEIWQKAKTGESDFVPAKVQWWEIDGRDEAWKNRQIKEFGQVFFAQEFACLDGEEEVTVETPEGEVMTITLKDLYELQC